MTVETIRRELDLWRRWEPFDPESIGGIRGERWRQQQVRELEDRLRREMSARRRQTQ